MDRKGLRTVLYKKQITKINTDKKSDYSTKSSKETYTGYFHEWKKLGSEDGSVYVIGVIEEEDGSVIDVENTDIQFIS